MGRSYQDKTVVELRIRCKKRRIRLTKQSGGYRTKDSLIRSLRKYDRMKKKRKHLGGSDTEHFVLGPRTTLYEIELRNLGDYNSSAHRDEHLQDNVYFLYNKHRPEDGDNCGEKTDTSNIQPGDQLSIKYHEEYITLTCERHTPTNKSVYGPPSIWYIADDTDEPHPTLQVQSSSDHAFVFHNDLTNFLKNETLDTNVIRYFRPCVPTHP